MNKDVFQFRYTATQRTEKSAIHFSFGLFGEKDSQNVWYPEPSPKDPILRVSEAVLFNVCSFVK